MNPAGRAKTKERENAWRYQILDCLIIYSPLRLRICIYIGSKMSTCVDEYTTNGEFPQVTQNAVLFVVATGILAVFRSYTFYLEFFDKPPTDDSKLKVRTLSVVYFL